MTKVFTVSIGIKVFMRTQFDMTIYCAEKILKYMRHVKYLHRVKYLHFDKNQNKIVRFIRNQAKTKCI